MEYRCISADCHIDLSWLPHDLFVVNASTAMRDRMPYVEQDGPAGPRWTTKSGLSMGLANGKGSKGALGVGTPFVAGRTHRDDRIAATGLYEDGSKGICRPTTPELRIRDQDRDGVQAEVMYGLHGHGHKIKDQESEFAGTFSYRGGGSARAKCRQLPQQAHAHDHCLCTGRRRGRRRSHRGDRVIQGMGAVRDTQQ